MEISKNPTDCRAGYRHATARNPLREYWVKSDKERIALMGILNGSLALSTDPGVAAQTEPERSKRERMIELLERCLQRLPWRARSLIMEYYSGRGADKIATRENPAQRLGVSANALRPRVPPMRDGLQRCVEKDGAPQPSWERRRPFREVAGASLCPPKWILGFLMFWRRR